MLLGRQMEVVRHKARELWSHSCEREGSVPKRRQRSGGGAELRDVVSEALSGRFGGLEAAVWLVSRESLRVVLKTE